MGKSLQSAGRLRELSRIVSSAKSQRPKQTAQQARSAGAAKAGGSVGKVESPKKKEMLGGREREQCRTPLASVVADCAKRWFHETLKEAMAGDPAMQVLVGQMYHAGYGVSRDPKKGHAWISKVSRIRSSVWKVSGKPPGYRASDSDSCEAENKAKSYR